MSDFKIIPDKILTHFFWPIQNAVNGTLNIARQAAQAGVKRIIVTSSYAALVTEVDPALDQANILVTEDSAYCILPNAE